MSLIINNLVKKNSFNISYQLTTNSLNQELLNKLPLIQNQQKRYAGHSKWQNIRHTKASKDSIKAKIYNKVSIGVTRAALKGIDPKYNKELASILEVARKSNVSKDLIDRALKRAQEQRLISVAKGFIGPNNIIGIASFLFDPRLTKPSLFLKPINREFKEFRFVDSKTLVNLFDKKGLIYISKYDSNLNPVNFEKIEEVAIESESEEIVIESEEDKIVPPLEIKDENNQKLNKKDHQTVEEDEDMLSTAKNWKLITSEEELLSAKGIIEKNYPDLIIKSYSVDYVAKETITLSEKELEKFNKFYSDLTEVEEFDKIFTNVY